MKYLSAGAVSSPLLLNTAQSTGGQVINGADRACLQGQGRSHLKVQTTLTFFIGEARLDGVVPFENILSAARAAVTPILEPAATGND